jgi:hypothetical protein
MGREKKEVRIDGWEKMRTQSSTAGKLQNAPPPLRPVALAAGAFLDDMLIM